MKAKSDLAWKRKNAPEMSASIRTIRVGNRKGKSVEFRRYNSLTEATTALTEGTAPAVSNITITNVTASLAQYGAVVQFTDLLGSRDLVQ